MEKEKEALDENITEETSNEVKDNEDENNILPVVARVGIRPRVVL